MRIVVIEPNDNERERDAAIRHAITCAWEKGFPVYLTVAGSPELRVMPWAKPGELIKQLENTG